MWRCSFAVWATDCVSTAAEPCEKACHKLLAAPDCSPVAGGSAAVVLQECCGERPQPKPVYTSGRPLHRTPAAVTLHLGRKNSFSS